MKKRKLALMIKTIFFYVEKEVHSFYFVLYLILVDQNPMYYPVTLTRFKQNLKMALYKKWIQDKRKRI